MDENTFKEYITMVNEGFMLEAADKFYKPEMYLLDDGHHYDKPRILKLIPLIKAQMKLVYHLVGYYENLESNAIAVEIEVEHVGLMDVQKQPFEEAGFPEAFIPLKQGEVFKSSHFYKYSFKDKMFTSSIGFTKIGSS